MVDDLAYEVLAPAFRDLSAAGLRPPEVVLKDSTSSPAQIVMLMARDGTGLGFRIEAGEDYFDLVARAAEKVQEWVFDQVQETGVSNWPPCPLHPGSHPLFVSVEMEQAVWRCRKRDVVVSVVGSLREIDA